MQVSVLWKRVTAAAGGLTAIVTLVLVWGQAGWPTLALSDDVERMERRIQVAEDRFDETVDLLKRRIDGNERILLYRERDRVEDKIDQLEQRYRQDPGNRALRELIRLREQERDRIDRQLDALGR